LGVDESKALLIALAIILSLLALAYLKIDDEKT